MLFIRICILNSYVNLNQNQSCQLQISSANNKCLLSCQFQSSTVLSTFLSNSSSCSYVNQIQFFFKIQFVSVNGQVASSHPRTACACRFVSAIGQAASSHPRTACTYPFGIRRAASSHPRTARVSFVPFSQVTSSNTRTACAFYFVSF